MTIIVKSLPVSRWTKLTLNYQDPFPPRYLLDKASLVIIKWPDDPFPTENIRYGVVYIAVTVGFINDLKKMISCSWFY